MVGFNTPIHHDRITLIPEHRGKHDNIELSPYRAAFFGSYNASEYLEINAQIRIWLRSTPTSPKPTLSLPRSRTANRSQRSCLTTRILLLAISGKKWTLSAESGISTSLNDRNKLLVAPRLLIPKFYVVPTWRI